MDVWVELKTAVFRRLVSLDGPALSEEQERNYKALIELLNKVSISDMHATAFYGPLHYACLA